MSCPYTELSKFEYDTYEDGGKQKTYKKNNPDFLQDSFADELNSFINNQIKIRELTEAFVFKRGGVLLVKGGFTISTTPDLITEFELIEPNQESQFVNESEEEILSIQGKLNFVMPQWIIKQNIDSDPTFDSITTTPKRDLDNNDL